MFEWIAQNIATLLIGLVLLLVTAAIIFRMLRNKKNGKSSCGCGCMGCPMSGACHKR